MKRFFRVLYWGTLAFCLARLLYLLLFPTPEVDLLNERIAECEYVGQFNEGLAVVKKEGKIGFVDKSGELVIPFKWDYEGNEYSLEEIKFSDGRCCIPNTRNTQAYLIDKEGREIYSGSPLVSSTWMIGMSCMFTMKMGGIVSILWTKSLSKRWMR